MKTGRIVALAALTAAGIAPAAHALEERTVTIDTRPGVRVGFVLIEPERPPVASAILFIGGSGKLRLWRRSGPLPLDRGVRREKQVRRFQLLCRERSRFLCR